MNRLSGKGGDLCTHLDPPTEKVARNKDVHFVDEVVEITSRISRSVDITVFSIRPLRQWFTEVRIIDGQKLPQIISSLGITETTSMVIKRMCGQ